MNNLVPFSFESHEVRVLTDDNGEPLFVAKDVAAALGYSNHSDAISRHCKGVVERYPLLTAGGMQELRVIREPDLYRMIFGSTLESAQAFERLVVEEILPSIRKTGRYEVAPATQPPFKIADPTLALAVQVAIEVDTIKQQNALMLQTQAELAARVQNVELQHRAMACLSVPTQKYIHHGEGGYDVSTFAYLESSVQPAVAAFLNDAVQDTPLMCRSPMLNNRRFRYVKGAYPKASALTDSQAARH